MDEEEDNMDMQKRLLAAAVSGLLAVGVSGQALAQAAQQQQQRQQQQAQMQEGQGPGLLIEVRDEMINKTLRNRAGEALGEIEEVVMDAQGNARYVIVSHGGFLDVGDQLTAVPYKALQPTKQSWYLLDMTKDQLAKAPKLDGLDWSKLEDESWAKQTYSYFKVEYPGQPRPSFAMLDENNDGFITEQEARQSQPVQSSFGQIDENKDNRLSEAEFAAFEFEQ